jgi:hypothetical protein
MIAGLATGETITGETLTVVTETGGTLIGEMIVPPGGGTTATNALSVTTFAAFARGETLTSTAFLETGVIALLEMGGAGTRGLASLLCQQREQGGVLDTP